MSISKKVLIFTATYNESENIEDLIYSIQNQGSPTDILIIDDNSPDKTYEKIIKLQSKFKNIYLNKRNGKLGLDSAHKEAYQFALNNNYNYLISMDADFSHDPKEIGTFISNLEKYPFVIGSRYVMGGKCFMKGRRLFVSKYGNKLMKLLLRINCNEFTTSYRGFNLDMLNNFHLDMITSKGYSFFMGTIHAISKLGFPIKEIPITFADRKKGYSKIPKFEIFRALKNLIILSILR